MIFLIELAIAVSVALVPLVVLHSHMRRMLTDQCGTVERAEFWIRYTYLVVVGVAMLATVMGTHQGAGAITGDIVRAAFTRALIGTLAALIGVGIQIVKFLPRPQ